MEGKRGNRASRVDRTSASNGMRAHHAEWHRSRKRADEENVREKTGLLLAENLLLRASEIGEESSWYRISKTSNSVSLGS